MPTQIPSPYIGYGVITYKEEWIMGHVSGSSFTLIVVLFILLIIVGSAYVC
ncbi:YjcZ family sporulation protein [Halalkalibacter lacteus]|uniref:YjcZ family sporulation protein n=1 Tax=Halalkalibacter lacteus TaxID=3090663 RepID=UPI002FC599E9